MNTPNPKPNPEPVQSDSQNLQRLSTGSDVEVQVRAANQNPRDVIKCLKEAQDLILSKPEIAEECFYTLERTDKKTGEKKIIQGRSIRFAEIHAACWQNFRIMTRVEGFLEDGKFVIISGNFLDVQKNNAFSIQVVRRLTYKDGNPYNDDMVQLQINNGTAFAYRNVMTKAIPNALTEDTYQKIFELLEKADPSETAKRRNRAILGMSQLGIGIERILFKMRPQDYKPGMAVKDIQALIGTLGAPDVKNLVGFYNSIKQGNSVPDSVFPAPTAPETEGKHSFSKPDIKSAPVAEAKTEPPESDYPTADDLGDDAGSTDAGEGESESSDFNFGENVKEEPEPKPAETSPEKPKSAYDHKAVLKSIEDCKTVVELEHIRENYKTLKERCEISDVQNKEIRTALGKKRPNLKG